MYLRRILALGLIGPQLGAEKVKWGGGTEVPRSDRCGSMNMTETPERYKPDSATLQVTGAWFRDEPRGTVVELYFRAGVGRHAGLTEESKKVPSPRRP